MVRLKEGVFNTGVTQQIGTMEAYLTYTSICDIIRKYANSLILAFAMNDTTQKERQCQFLILNNF